MRNKHSHHVLWVAASAFLLVGCASTTPSTGPNDTSGGSGATAGALPSKATTTLTTEPPAPSPSFTIKGLQVSADTAAPVAADLTRLVVGWIRYVRTGNPSFRFADSIGLSVGGRDAGVISDPSARLHDRTVWRRCPAGSDIYGASSCPVNFLSPMHAAAVNDQQLVYTGEFEQVTCAPAAGPAQAKTRFVIIRPSPQWRTCASDFALTLSVDSQGRLSSVDITLAAP